MKRLIPCCVLLTIVFGAGLVVGTPPATLQPVSAHQPDKPDRIKELQEKRIAVLKDILDITEKTFKGGQVSFDQVIKVKLDLLHAQLDATQTKDERIRIREDMVKQAEALEMAVKRRFEAREVPVTDALKAQAFVLETKIALERDKAAKR